MRDNPKEPSGWVYFQLVRQGWPVWGTSEHDMRFHSGQKISLHNDSIFFNVFIACLNMRLRGLATTPGMHAQLACWNSWLMKELRRGGVGGGEVVGFENLPNSSSAAAKYIVGYSLLHRLTLKWMSFANGKLIAAGLRWWIRWHPSTGESRTFVRSPFSTSTHPKEDVVREQQIHSWTWV